MSRLIYLTPALAISTQGLPNPDKPEIPKHKLVFEILAVCAWVLVFA
jgi:hypothetical protein